MCITDAPSGLCIRDYKEGRQTNEKKQMAEDLETAMVRMVTLSELFKIEGYEAKGLGNATKGSVPLA